MSDLDHRLAAAARGRLGVIGRALVAALGHFDLAATRSIGAAVLVALLEGLSHGQVPFSWELMNIG
jgi:hypothetical protein